MTALYRTRLSCLLAIFLACAGAPAAYGDEAQPQACGPGLAGSPCATEQVAGMDSTGGTPQGAGNPVNLITGNKHQRETDMAPLPGVLGLELVRHYNSHAAAPGMPLHDAGRGWTFSYDTSLSEFLCKRGHEIMPKGMFHDRRNDYQKA